MFPQILKNIDEIQGAQIVAIHIRSNSLILPAILKS